MSSLKLRKIAKIVKEINIDPSQTRYDIAGLTLGLCKFFYRTPQNLFQDLNIGDYTIDTSNNSQVLVIQNNELLRIMEAVQVCYILDITSSKYETDFNVDINQLKDEYNNLVDDVHALWDYIKKVGIVADDTSIPLILPQLNTDEVWVKTEDGYKGISLTDAEGIIKGVIEEYTSLMEKRLDAYVEDPLKPRLNEYVETVNKPELDRYVEETNKPALDDYTTQLEERLQAMIDQAVADKGLMPQGSNWFEIDLGNWLVTDLFNKNYTNYPPQLKSTDNAGVVKKDITDGGKSQVIRYYTTTGKMFFAVRVNEIWSEWQELGGQTDTMQFTQANHGFIFTAVTLDGATRKWVKANKYTSADGIAIKIDNDRFDVVTRGIVNIPTQARDDKGEPFVYDEYYFLSQEVDGGLSRTKNEIGTFQYLAHISEIDGKQVAYIDIGDSYDLDYEVVDNETADRVGIGTYKTTLRTADTIEDLKRLNLKEGDVVEVLGYYTKGDGANHKRKIESSDGGSGVLLENGLYANIIHNGEVNVSWFGAKGDGVTDDTQAIQKALNYTNKILIPAKTYKVTTLNVNKIIQEISGEHSYYSQFITDSNTLFNINTELVKLKNIFFKGSSNNCKCFLDNRPYKELRGDFDLTVDGCRFLNFSNIVTCYGRGIFFRNNIFSGCSGTYFYLDFPSKDRWESQEDYFAYKKSRRGYHIFNNKFHYNSVKDTDILVEIIEAEAELHELFIKNNVFERVMKVVKGSCYSSEIVVDNISTFLVGNYPENSKLKSIFEIKNSENSTFEVSNINTHLEYNESEMANKIMIVNGSFINNVVKINVSDVANQCLLLNESSILKFNDISIFLNGKTKTTQACLEVLSSVFDNNYVSIKCLIDEKKLLTSVFSNAGTNNFKLEYSKKTNSPYNLFLPATIKTTLTSLEDTTINIPIRVNQCVVRGLFKDSDVISNIKGNELTSAVTRNSDYSYSLSSLNQFFTNPYIEVELRADIGDSVNFRSVYNMLNTVEAVEQMKKEMVYDDFDKYMLEKESYEKQLQTEEETKQQAYQQALLSTLDLSYDDFLKGYPVPMTMLVEPTIPKSVQDFMKKYLEGGYRCYKYLK